MHRFDEAKQAIEIEYADVNFHSTITTDDYSQNEWTPLMHAIAEYCYVMVIVNLA